MEKGKSLIGGQGQPRHLVICLSPFISFPDAMYYRFESFPISKLTCGGHLKRKWLDDGPSLPVENPEGVFVWCDDDNPSNLSNPRHWSMCFLHVGGGQVYAAGGIAPVDYSKTYFSLSVATLNKEFRCISFSSPLESSTVECKRSMQIRTYNPLMVEIGGLIYVLSAPPDFRSKHTEPTGFEVYNPLTDAWTTLKAPDFLEGRLAYMPSGVTGYSSVVIGNKLCVSTARCSATFDTKTNEWGPCDLFSECKLKRATGFPPFRHFSPPFPFDRNAVFYRNNIILCVRNAAWQPGLVAFKITDDKKAIQMSLHFDGMPKEFSSVSISRMVDIVDLGDDVFAVMSDGSLIDREGAGEIVIVTFKVVTKMMKNEEGEDEGLVCQLKKITCCNVECSFGKGWRHPIYWFTM